MSPARARDPWGVALLALAGLGTALGIVSAGDGTPLAAVVPVLGVGVAFAVIKLPVRYSATALVFLMLALEIESDAGGIWATPLVGLGELLDAGLGKKLPINVAGFELAVLVLLVVALAQGRSAAHVPAPRPIWDFLAIYLAGVALSEVVGLSKGLGFAPWKLRYLLHGPLFFVFFQACFRTPADLRLIGGAVVAAAQVKALLAAWVQLEAAPALTGGRLATATNHGDSVLFALAILVVLVPALERPGLRTALYAAALAALPIWGVFLNNRRLAWAMLAMSLFSIFAMSPWTVWKRALVKGLLIGAPVVAAYLAAGWNHTGGGILSPVAKLRSMVDSKDPSTYWREVEAWNVANTIRNGSILGTGLGGEYVETMANDSVAEAYREYREWPHNTVLGLMLYMGLFGFAAIWLVFPLTVFLALRSYHHASSPEERSAAWLCIAAVVCNCAMAWGDTGAHFKQCNLAFGVSLALAGKLAVATGAWRSRSAPAAARPTPAFGAPEGSPQVW